MSLARRTFAALSGVLLLHLALQASGSLCAMQAASHGGDMQGMPAGDFGRDRCTGDK